eukprot:scaffold17953_cov91-Phaeocystis_antarctica.AAC.1
MKLGRVLDIMMEQFVMSRHQHRPAVKHNCMWPALLVAPHLLSTRKVSSKLATSSSSNAAVGETVARRTVERRSSHIRHGGRERRDRYLPPAIAPRWRSFYALGYLSPSEYTGAPSQSGAAQHGLRQNQVNACAWPTSPGDERAGRALSARGSVGNGDHRHELALVPRAAPTGRAGFCTQLERPFLGPGRAPQQLSFWGGVRNAAVRGDDDSSGPLTWSPPGCKGRINPYAFERVRRRLPGGPLPRPVGAALALRAPTRHRDLHT